MQEVVRSDVVTVVPAVHSRAAHQAFKTLQVAFIVAPTIAGLDKFTHLLANWDQYLAPAIATRLPMPAHTFMQGVGIIEVAAALLVAVKPKIGGMVVGAWILGIIANLILGQFYYDIALRDLGLALGAFAMARLATEHDRVHEPSRGTSAPRMP